MSLLWELWELLTIPIKNHSINLKETFMLIYMQKIEFFTHFFLQRKITNLLFWVIWVCLSTHTKNDSINSKKHLMFICRQKSTLSFMFSLRLLFCILYCKLVILATLGMPEYTSPSDAISL